MNAYFSLLADLVWLVPLLPLLAGLLIVLRILAGRACGDAGEPGTARLAEAAALGSLLLLLALDLGAWLTGVPGQLPGVLWFANPRWRAEFSFLLDPLSLSVATVSALIGWLVTRFSRNYLHREAGFQRFFIVLMLFLAGIQLLFLAGNSLLLFIGWEWCGLASFLLIGYQRQRPLATGNALFALTSNRVGDAGLLFALGLSAFWLGDFSWARLHDPALSVIELRLLALGFVVAALVKSAQFPFSPWIIRALEGPTPSSAIFYGAVLIHAGVYLLLRLEPALARVPDIMYGLVAVGSLTAVYAWFCAQVQTDVKSGLIFGTLFQVALMVVAIGCGWTTVALVHLCLHTAWRAWQFLVAPSWLQWSRQRPSSPPAWLARRQGWYTAALQRFWLGKLEQILIVQPTEAFAHDLRQFERAFVDRVVGEPGSGVAPDPQRPLVRVDGWPGLLLGAVSDHLDRLEQRLLLRGRGGFGERLLRRLAGYLATVENLLEQPRYLMMAVMATFVVIL
ncbi:proton-conducting transporter membrane subunit [Dechloromonas sp. ZY10]|uniref:proton-conducting transporter transmembrane domain-containing protein n=1 Tax=Dechloromonas aquae TaxID=2664436 RepID=UPI003526F49E